MKRSNKILVISGSPVSGSSTDFLLDKIANTIKEQNNELEIVTYKLNDLKIKPCIACGESPEPKFCIYDDLNHIYDELLNCTCLLFGSPVYFDSVSAQAKLFIDRCNCFKPPDYKNETNYLFKKRTFQKIPGAMVLVGGEDSWYEGARRVIAGFFKWVSVVNEGYISYGSYDYNIRCSVKDSVEKLEEAKKLGLKLSKLIQDENYG